MSNVLQTLFNTNHELPDLQVIVILAILAIVAPSVAKYLPLHPVIPDNACDLRFTAAFAAGFWRCGSPLSGTLEGRTGCTAAAAEQDDKMPRQVLHSICRGGFMGL